MPSLTSITKPASGPEAAGLELEVVAQRAETKGCYGNEPATDSRASRAYVVAGKGEPIRPRFASGGSVETVIGIDQRVRILETDLQPWRMICALRMFGSTGGGAIGTGWLVGPKTVVTAGHCVHHMGFFGGWATRIEVSAGRNGDEFPFATVDATRVSSVDRWINQADPDFDLGCIHLDEPLGDQVGWFSIGALPAADLESHLVNISGYPGDRGNGEEQYFHANRILHVSDRRVFYDVDTFGGQSGAPVWIHEQEQSPPLVVAIHAYGTGGTPFNLGITANSAPRIIPEVFDIIQGWLADDGG